MAPASGGSRGLLCSEITTSGEAAGVVSQGGSSLTGEAAATRKIPMIPEGAGIVNRHSSRPVDQTLKT